MKNRFTEEQIIGVFKEAEAGGKIADLCRKHGISDVAVYSTVTDLARLRGLSTSVPRASAV